MSASIDGAYAHLERMTDRLGLFEHADRDRPRLEHGRCTDDNARLLVVTSRDPDVGAARRLSRVALAFVLSALDDEGKCRNRMDVDGSWTDVAGTEDCWGRAVWALGTAAVRHADGDVRRSARLAFDRTVRHRAPDTRSMAFAALGAAEVLARVPSHHDARTLLADALATIGRDVGGADWPWPERRLTYANAALAEAVLAAGTMLGRDADTAHGLAMLGWLLDRETLDGHLSVTPVGGAGPADGPGRFDQQPIEVAAMADACARAFSATGDPRWSAAVERAGAWFDGANDLGLVMHDERTGGGYDGLQDDRVNVNQGAESTLAFLSTMQHSLAFARAT
jgi:hypothetical protein